MRPATVLLLTTLAPSLGAAAAPPLEGLYSLMDAAGLEQAVREAEGARAADPGDTAALKRGGVAWHNLAVTGRPGASEEAVRWLRQAREALADDREVTAYLGSALTLEARDTWNPVAKMSGVSTGTALLDRAVREAPDNPAVRLVRANNSLALPEFFGRRDLALEDLSHLAGIMEAQGMAPTARAEICVKLGDLLAAQGEAERAARYFARARELVPDSPHGQAARDRP